MPTEPQDSPPPGRRRALTPLWLLGMIALVPVLVWLYAVWMPSRLGCDYFTAFDHARHNAHAAFSMYWRGVRASAENPHSMPRSNQGAMAAQLEILSADGSRRVVPAWNDLTFVSCALEPQERVAQIWFSEFRDARIFEALQSTGSLDASGNGLRTVISSRSLPGPRSEAWIDSSILQLQILKITYAAMFPGWLEVDLTDRDAVLGWLDQGVLLRGTQPDQIFLVNAAAGITGRMDGSGRCLDSRKNTPLCRDDGDLLAARFGFSLLRSGQAEQARLQLLSALRGADTDALALEIARGTVQAFMTGTSWRGQCPALSEHISRLRTSPVRLAHASGTGTEHASSTPDPQQRAFVDELAQALEHNPCVAASD
jgi:hypothetical protein